MIYVCVCVLLFFGMSSEEEGLLFWSSGGDDR